jgi:hypothetical protein
MTALLSILSGRNVIGETLTDEGSQSVLVLIKHISAPTISNNRIPI